MHCYGCGAAKDMTAEEVYPWPDEQSLGDGPLPPLFCIECVGVARGHPGDGYRMAVVCHACFHRLDPDMWIGERAWAGLNPRVPYDRLPRPLDDVPYEDRWNPANYPELARGA